MWYFGLLLLRTTDYSNWANDVRRFREGDRPDCPNGLDKEMWDVIFDRFLDMDPSKRITAEDAIPILRKLINRAADESFQPTIDALEVVRASC
ncbi:hypothetical protein BD410DRAFT_283479 [Rickenella mellea]|uniref:Protein kinase domain-containing protein n=1 Tax=Rickenella mellea TaxID=50990 RepID=A0A4Y7Q4P5_9AGAM|nr:hypothetical protein BD410DRAFT_283479 [Rickenella mellea]